MCSPCKLCGLIANLSFLKDVIYLFIERGEGREKERERNIAVWEMYWLVSCLLHNPNWGPGPQPRRVPWLGIELVTFLVTGWHLIHWATPARPYFKASIFIFSFNLLTVLIGWYYQAHVAKGKTELRKMKSFSPGQNWDRIQACWLWARDSWPSTTDGPSAWAQDPCTQTFQGSSVNKPFTEITNPREDYFLENRFSIEFL